MVNSSCRALLAPLCTPLQTRDPPVFFPWEDGHCHHTSLLANSFRCSGGTSLRQDLLTSKLLADVPEIHPTAKIAGVSLEA